MNKKGFVLVETLVVTIFTLFTFTILYNSAVPLLGKYKELSYYDDLDTTYDLYYINKLIKNDSNYITIKNNHYKKIACSDISLDNRNKCNELLRVLEFDNTVDELIFLNTDYTEELKNDTVISDDVKKYLDYINPSGNILLLQNNGYISYLNSILEVMPTVDIYINGDTYSSGYKSGATVTVTCESKDGISNFSPIDSFGRTFSITGDNYSKQATITLNGYSDGRTISVSCTSNSNLTNSDYRIYKIYQYSSHSDCGVSSYSYSGSCSCKTSSGDTMGEQCNANIYAHGSCSNWCRSYQGNDGNSYTYQSGSCVRNTNYNTCWHS